MCIENERLLFPEILFHLVLNFCDLLPRDQQRFLETCDFLDPFVGLDLIARHLDIALNINEYLTISDALRGGDAWDGDFVL